MGKIIYKVKKQANPLEESQIEELKVDANNLVWGKDVISISDLKAKVKRLDDEIKERADKKLIYQRQIKKIKTMLDVGKTEDSEDVDDSEIPTKPEVVE